MEVVGLEAESLQKSYTNGFVAGQIEKYEANLAAVKTEFERVFAAYPEVYRYLRGCWPNYERLNIMGLSHIQKNQLEFQVEGESVFIAPTLYLQNVRPELGRSNPGVLGRTINTLAVVGLVRKHTPAEVPAAFLHIISSFGNQYNWPNFYTVPRLDEKLLELASQRVGQLQNADIKASAIKEKTVQSVFGEAFSASIYHASKK